MKNEGVSSIIVIAVVAIVVVVVGIGVYLATKSSSGTNNPPSQTPHTYNIVNGTISVSARNYQAYTFTVPSDVTDVYVTGSFIASGGTGNDIEVLIMDATQFINWQNGHSSGNFYDSGQLTTSNFNVTLPAGGSYYLVYSNTFALLLGKDVQTVADLHYSM